MTEYKDILILYLEGEPGPGRLVRQKLEQDGFAVELQDCDSADLLAQNSPRYDVIIVGQVRDWQRCIGSIHSMSDRHSGTPFIVIIEQGNEQMAIQALRLGANDFVIRDPRNAYLRLLAPMVERALYQGRIIQERARALDALRESEARYRTLVEQIPAIIYITSLTESSTTFYVSPQIERILGFSQAEWSEGPNLWIGQLYPQDRRRVLEELGLCLDKGEPFGSEYRLVARDGRILWFHDEAVVVRDGDGAPLRLQGVRLDITERKQAEEALERRLDELNLLNTASRVMVSSLDLETVMETTMRQAVQVLQVEAGSVLLLDQDTGELVFAAASGGGASGLRGRRLSPSRGVAGWVAQRSEALIVPDVQRDDRFNVDIDANSGFTTRSILCVPLVSRGKTIGVMEALNKIDREFRPEDQHLLEALAATASIAIENAQLYDKAQRELRERMRAEQELKKERESLAQRVAERTAELSAANAELARAARLKDEFLASVSHELRTPLNAILGLSEALQEQVYGPLNEKQLRSLHSIEESGRHLLSLITDILDVSKIEAGKLELDIGPISVQSVCQASLGLIKQQAHKKQLKVCSLFDDGATMLQADQRRLKQILVNLLSNAVKFTPEGGSIGLEVKGDAEQEVIRFTVWDTGIGIPQNDMARLFQPFVQLDSSLSRQYAGTGLGLALVRRLTEMHGGGVALASRAGQGSRFTVSLPWLQSIPPVTAPAWDVAVTEVSVASVESPPPSARQLTILLAEDNEVNINTLLDYLHIKGYRVRVARNGLEAIERAREEKPGMILMDIQMPEMDGLTAIRRLRADPSMDEVPIIALTALAMPGDRERVLQAGADDYLSKPVGLKNLIQIIERRWQALQNAAGQQLNRSRERD